MRLILQEAGWVHDGAELGSDRALIYDVAGLPLGEHAKIAQYNSAWRILRWNDEWHGNWTGNYSTADAALNALRQELLTAA